MELAASGRRTEKILFGDRPWQRGRRFHRGFRLHEDHSRSDRSLGPGWADDARHGWLWQKRHPAPSEALFRSRCRDDSPCHSTCPFSKGRGCGAGCRAGDKGIEYQPREGLSALLIDPGSPQTENPMDVRVPRLAEGVESATVANILVSPGDRIEKDQVILELETEKAVGPIPSPGSGEVSKIHVKQGDEVAVGQVLITLAERAVVGKAPQAEKTEQRAGDRKTVRQVTPQEREELSAPEKLRPDQYQYESKSGFAPPASPAVRRIARELDIDLTRVRGTEAGGRIIVGDLSAYIQALQ